MRVLVEHGAALDPHMLEGDTPMHQAAWQGNTDGIRVLLDKKADVQATKVCERFVICLSAQGRFSKETI